MADRTAAAENAEAFSRGILESLTDPFAVHDADWRFRYINEAAAGVFRLSPSTFTLTLERVESHAR